MAARFKNCLNYADALQILPEFYLIYFLWVASHHNRAAAGLEMRADGSGDRDRDVAVIIGRFFFGNDI